jgi:hypothetical protein
MHRGAMGRIFRAMPLSGAGIAAGFLAFHTELARRSKVFQEKFRIGDFLW